MRRPMIHAPPPPPLGRWTIGLFFVYLLPSQRPTVPSAVVWNNRWHCICRNR
jgi:hypothetical protein